MMLRWISLEPPAIVLAKLTKKPSTQRPASWLRSASVTGPYGPWISMPSSNSALPSSERRQLQVRVLGRGRALRERR